MNFRGYTQEDKLQNSPKIHCSKKCVEELGSVKQSCHKQTAYPTIYFFRQRQTPHSWRKRKRGGFLSTLCFKLNLWLCFFIFHTVHYAFILLARRKVLHNLSMSSGASCNLPTYTTYVLLSPEYRLQKNFDPREYVVGKRSFVVNDIYRKPIDKTKRMSLGLLLLTFSKWCHGC